MGSTRSEPGFGISSAGLTHETTLGIEIMRVQTKMG